MPEDVKPADSTAAAATPATPAEAKAPEVKAEAKAAETPAAETKPAEGKAAEGEKKEVPAEKKPLELKLVEGSPLTEEHLGIVKKFAEENDLTQAQAQKLLEQQGVGLKAFNDNMQAKHDELVKGWQNEALNDPALGNGNPERLKEINEHAHRAAEWAGGPEFMAFLEQNKLGNHPQFLKAFKKMGDAMKEAKFQVPPGTPPTDKPVSELFYGPNK